MPRSFLDYDSGRGYLWRVGPFHDDLHELVRMEARRLGGMFPLGSIALILRSDNGWHLRFPEARLSREEEESVMWASKSHYGHVWFSCLIGDTTLRVSRKPYGPSFRPCLWEVIQLGTVQG